MKTKSCWLSTLSTAWFIIILFFIVAISGIFTNDLDATFGSLVLLIPSIAALYFFFKKSNRIKQSIQSNVKDIPPMNTSNIDDSSITVDHAPQIMVKINNPYRSKRDTDKPKLIRKSLNDYCVLDLETTGLYSDIDNIIEIGILKVRNNIITDRYSQLINPEKNIPKKITRITGITNEMVVDMPTIDKCIYDVYSFIDNDIILGHNTNFDLKFLHSLQNNFNVEFDNDYMDTLSLSRRTIANLPNYKLTTLREYLHLHENSHRSIDDCIATKELYDYLKSIHELLNAKIETSPFSHDNKFDLRYYDFNKASNKLEGIHFVFDGMLKISSNLADVYINYHGATRDQNVTLKTDYLVKINIHDTKKYLKALDYQKKYDKIKIITEEEFYNLIAK